MVLHPQVGSAKSVHEVPPGQCWASLRAPLLMAWSHPSGSDKQQQHQRQHQQQRQQQQQEGHQRQLPRLGHNLVALHLPQPPRLAMEVQHSQ